jgi:hypothetical protein
LSTFPTASSKKIAQFTSFSGKNCSRPDESTPNHAEFTPDACPIKHPPGKPVTRRLHLSIAFEGRISRLHFLAAETAMRRDELMNPDRVSEIMLLISGVVLFLPLLLILVAAVGGHAGVR